MIPVKPNSNDHYYVIMNPDCVTALRHQSARDLYRQQSHGERFKRRYGRYPQGYEASIEVLSNFLDISNPTAEQPQ